MTYTSVETRKILEHLDQYGVALPESEYYQIELSVCTYWQTRIVKTIDKVLKGGHPEKKLARIDALGWDYFAKPLKSMLTAGAYRTEQIEVESSEWVEQVYRLVTSSLLLADFNMKELGLLLVDIPPIVGDVHSLSRAIAACKAQNSRSVYYLHGVIKREYQTTQGKIREIQQQSAEAEGQGWTPPAEFEKMDVTERKTLAADWKDRLNSIRISQELNRHDWSKN